MTLHKHLRIESSEVRLGNPTFDYLCTCSCLGDEDDLHQIYGGLIQSNATVKGIILIVHGQYLQMDIDCVHLQLMKTLDFRHSGTIS